MGRIQPPQSKPLGAVYKSMSGKRGLHIPHIPHPHIPKPHGFMPHVLDQYIHSKWAHYVFQCGLAAVSLVFILLIGDTVFKTAIVVGIASSAFTVFVIPDSVAATPRKVIGGHFVAGVVAAVISLSIQLTGLDALSQDKGFFIDIAAAISVGVGIFVMVVTNTEHPPEAGTSLGLVFYGFDWTSIVFILLSAILLSLVRVALRPKMINLL